MRKSKRYNYLARFQHRVLENPFILSAEGDPDGGAGGGGGGDAKPDPAAILAAFQAEVSTTLKNISTEIANIKKTHTPTDLSSITTAIAELKAEMTALKETGPEKKADGGDGDNTDKGEKEKDTAQSKMLSEMEKQLKKLSTELETERTKAKEETEKRQASESRQRALERDRLIIAAYRSAGGRDDVEDKAVLRQFRDEFSYSDDETWTTEDGVDITGFIKKNLPGYMKKPKTASGGSGGHSPGAEDQPTLTQLKQAAIEAGTKAKKAGIGTRESAVYERAKRAYAEAGGSVMEITDAITQA